MFEIETPKTFTESGIAREANYSSQYQLTKLANDTYQFYDFAERNAEICNARGALKHLASVRGGRALDKELTKHILNMDNFATVTVTASALSLNKKASTENKEPWKVVAINGAEYFVSADTEDEEVEPAKQVTAAANVKHVYTVNIKAHNLSEITKIADMAAEKLHAIPGTTQVPDVNCIVFDVVSDQDCEAAQASIQKELEGGEIYLPNAQVGVHNDCCPCGCGKQVHVEPVQQEKQIAQIPEQMPEGSFVLISPMSNVASFADNMQTLKTYASAHYTDYKIYNDKKEVIAEMRAGVDVKPEGETFGEALSSLASNADEVLKKLAEDVTVINPDGTLAQPGSKVQQGSQVINQQTGTSTTIQKTEAAEEPEKAIDPNEKPSEETGATGDDEVKRWKGMREDPQTGKFIVYITETEEHIYDNADDAINFLVRK